MNFFTFFLASFLACLSVWAEDVEQVNVSTSSVEQPMQSLGRVGDNGVKNIHNENRTQLAEHRFVSDSGILLMRKLYATYVKEAAEEWPMKIKLELLLIQIKNTVTIFLNTKISFHGFFCQ